MAKKILDETIEDTVEAISEQDPTPQEAAAMFLDNQGLASVQTTVGIMTRDGLFYPVLRGE